MVAPAGLYLGIVNMIDKSSAKIISPLVYFRYAPGLVGGTAAYQPPEVFDEGEGLQSLAGGVKPSVDVWAFACLMYEAVTGREVPDEEPDRPTCLGQIAALRRDPDESLEVFVKNKLASGEKRQIRRDSSSHLRQHIISSAKSDEIGSGGSEDEDNDSTESDSEARSTESDSADQSWANCLFELSSLYEEGLEVQLRKSKVFYCAADTEHDIDEGDKIYDDVSGKSACRMQLSRKRCQGPTVIEFDDWARRTKTGVYLLNFRRVLLLLFEQVWSGCCSKCSACSQNAGEAKNSNQKKYQVSAIF